MDHPQTYIPAQIMAIPDTQIIYYEYDMQAGVDTSRRREAGASTEKPLRSPVSHSRFTPSKYTIPSLGIFQVAAFKSYSILSSSSKPQANLGLGPVTASLREPRTRTAIKRGKKVKFQALPPVVRQRSKVVKNKLLEPIITYCTAHATSPRDDDSFHRSTADDDESETETRVAPPSSPLSSPPPTSTVDPLNIEGAESSQLRQSGLEEGYENSSMANLVWEYHAQTETDLSLFARANSIARKRNLELKDIMDRGVEQRERRLSRFGLIVGYRLRVERTMRDMQSLLSRAAGLIDKRDKHFIVDPDRVLSDGLLSPTNVRELNSTWLALSERMDLAQWTFSKYKLEFKARKESDILKSPISTDVGIYESFPKDISQSVRLNHLYDHVPNMRKLWLLGYAGQDDSIANLMDIPEVLEQSFPDRPLESKPRMVFYTAEGERRKYLFPPGLAMEQGPSSYFLPRTHKHHRRGGGGTDRSLRGVLIDNLARAQGNPERGIRAKKESAIPMNRSIPKCQLQDC
ncbi:hypothetical protein C8R45DRAFT_1182626 [Mycena sanguinolenta]|nr:hypothetical protein C8R45DRAFT_1182626 [Mycena sanguinolenta]